MRIKEGLVIKPLYRLINRLTPQRIAIVGTQASGKTVFLTSLISHLQNHEQDKMNLGDNIQILQCKPLPNAKQFASFPYKYHRSLLVKENAWPDKTADVSLYTCRLKIEQDRKQSVVDLEFLDFPGERAADFAMYSRSYAEWSDWTLAAIKSDHDYIKLATEFLQALEKAEVHEDELVHAYKLFLGRAVHRVYGRIITPSTFLLDQLGLRLRKQQTEEEWATTRWSGLNEAEQFVPLPHNLRSSNRELCDAFEKRYCQYCKSIVKPLVKWITDSDQIYLLTDVATILSAGPSMYNDEKNIAETLLDLCDQEGGFWSLARQWMGALLMGPARITRIGVVATKSDLVRKNDIDNLESLATKMLKKTLMRINVKHKEFFTVSSVSGTEKLKDGRLRGHLVLDENGRKIPREESVPKEYDVSKVPEKWPLDDEWMDYSFAEVYPKVSKREDEPPQHFNLDRIVRFMLKLKKEEKP
jgi:uncharacterized protein